MIKIYCDGATTNGGGNTRDSKANKKRAFADNRAGSYLFRKQK